MPRFLGRSQEDAQELLTFLLDGLHECENEVKIKQYVKMAVEDQEQPEEVKLIFHVLPCFYGTHLIENS